MKKNSGMRPHDIAILLKISTYSDKNWFAKDIAFGLNISGSEVSESLNRSVIAGLLSNDKKTLMKRSLMEFLEFGLKYVFPVVPGAIVRGVSTSHSASPLAEVFQSEENFVWPLATGNERGQAIKPLHPKLPEACLKDFELYELLALTDALRVGRAREKKLAIKLLRERVMK